MTEVVSSEPKKKVPVALLVASTLAWVGGVLGLFASIAMSITFLAARSKTPNFSYGVFTVAFVVFLRAVCLCLIGYGIRKSKKGFATFTYVVLVLFILGIIASRNLVSPLELVIIIVAGAITFSKRKEFN
jgi:hypothetical protein